MPQSSPFFASLGKGAKNGSEVRLLRAWFEYACSLYLCPVSLKEPEVRPRLSEFRMAHSG